MAVLSSRSSTLLSIGAPGILKNRVKASQRSIIIATPFPESSLSLGPNELDLQEGFWAISLRSPEGGRWYNLSFGFLGPGQLLISSIQGSPGERNEGLERARSLTKAAHGLRPPNLLFEALKSAARHWGISSIIGIDPKHHIKGRWNQRKKRLRFDYVGFWTEAGATLDEGGNWKMSIESNRKNLGEVASKKRSMYRKRFEMLDKMEDQIQAALRQSAVGPTSNGGAGVL